jgi:hypothetical protein
VTVSDLGPAGTGQLHRHPRLALRLGHAESELIPRGGHRGRKGTLQPAELDPILGTLGAGQAGADRGEVEGQGLLELRVRRVPAAEDPLGNAVGAHQLDEPGRPPGGGEVGQGLLVDREVAHGGTVLRRHVGDGRAVGHGQIVEAPAVELHELAHHALLPEQLGDRQHQIGGGGALG